MVRFCVLNDRLQGLFMFLIYIEGNLSIKDYHNSPEVERRVKRGKIKSGHPE